MMQHKFQEILDQTGLKTSVVARDTGIPYNTLNDWRKGRTKKISLENVSKLAEYFHVSVASFLEEDDDPVLINVTKRTYDVAAGQGRINESYESADASDSGLAQAKIVGDSMLPALHDGDTVLIEPTTEVSPSDFAIVKINGDESTCKHVEITDTGIWLRAENKEVYADKFYTVQEVMTLPVTIIGKAVEMRRKL